jgi:hypothetical protein
MRALSLGVLAVEALAQNWTAKVIGVTSGGVFVLAHEQWVLFLTYSPFRAPGTINLERSLIDLKENERGSPVELMKDRVTFSDSGLSVDVNGAVVWDGGEGGTVTADQRAGIAGRLARATLIASEQKGEQGLAPALPWVVGKVEAALAGDLTEKVLAGLSWLRIAIRNCSPDGVIAAARAIIGRGRGLTPSADDCLAGVLLALNRWKGITNDFDLAAVNETVVRLASEKTTSLSTTIIHAAALGQGDERLLQVIDGLITGDLTDNALQDLVQMGHSSGVDSLVGMALALTA